jgi:threonine/homoserine/homoserine lactone efflux protein
MDKWLCWGTLGTAGLLLLIFLMNLILGTPFGRDNWLVDIIGILSCGLVGYLAWEAYRELR